MSIADEMINHHMDRMLSNKSLYTMDEKDYDKITKSTNNKMSEQQSPPSEVKKEEGIVLPTESRPRIADVPRHMIIYGKPKCGKTTAVMQLPNVLLIDIEDGSAFVSGKIMTPPKGLGPASRYKWLKEVAKTIKEADKPYDFVVIDTLSQLDSESEWTGTRSYMASVSGKKFNRHLDKNENLILKDGKPIEYKPTEPEYESVHSLAHGYGYRWSREAMMNIIDILKDCGKICTIFICHVTDKMIGEKNGEQVMVKDLALTGKLQSWVPRHLDCIANVWNEEGKFMISFDGNEDRIGGMRGTSHLQGYKGPLDWSQVFKLKESK